MRATDKSKTKNSKSKVRTKSKKTAIRRKKIVDEWVNVKGGNPKFRRKVRDLYDKKGICLTILEPGCFDWGIKRVGCKKDGFCAVYDYDKTVNALAKDYLKTNSKDGGYTMEQAVADAVDWVEFNTIRSLPYARPNGPIMVYTDENGKEMVA